MSVLSEALAAATAAGVVLEGDLSVAEAQLADAEAQLAAARVLIAELQEAVAEPEPTPDPTPEPEPSVGLYGTHYPEGFPTYNTPGVEVDCTWADIRNALTAGQKVILVRPGTLPGKGMGSSSARVLENVDGGGALIRPRDGYGTVTLSGDISIRSLSNIAFLGFDGEKSGIMIRACTNVVWGWSEMKKVKIYDHKSVRLIEWVARDAVVEGDDRLDVWPVGGDSGVTEVVGCYIAPIWRPAGSGHHTDTVQIERVNGGTLTGPFIFRDTIAFGASSQGFMFANVPNVTLDNFTLVGGRANEGRYPRPSNADMPEHEPRAMNGGGTVTLVGENRVYGIVTSGYTFSGPGTLERLPGSAPSTDPRLDLTHPAPSKAELVAAWR